MNLGQLQYLRALCMGRADQKWRNLAGQLIEIEAKSNIEQKQNLIKAFNKGYYLEQDRHNVCSEAVLLDVAAISENGRQLAGMLGHPFREE